MPEDFEDLIRRERAERSRQEQQLKKQQEDEMATHSARAKEFINAMHSRGVRPLPVYYSAGSYRPPHKLGEGWIIRDCTGYMSKGLVLMTDGRVSEYGWHGEDSKFAIPVPHVYVRLYSEDERRLARGGSDRMLAQAVVDHEQGRLKRPSQRPYSPSYSE